MDAKGTDTERVPAIDRLPREEAPSPALEQRVIGALRRQGLLRRRPRVPPLPRLAAAVAAVALLAIGWLAGSRSGRPQPGDDSVPAVAVLQPTHLLLLRAGDGYRPAPTPAAERQRVQEYRLWAQQESRAGRLSDGHKLALDGEVVTAGDPALPTGEVQGLFLVVAPDLATAVDVAHGCPHVRYGGAIEVRPIERS